MRFFVGLILGALAIVLVAGKPPTTAGEDEPSAMSAETLCERSLSEDARGYVQANPQWTLVTLESLADDDQQLWQSVHDDACPGVADVAYDGDGAPQALALLSLPENGALTQTLVVVGSGGEVVTLVAPDEVSRPSVVWVGSTGTITDRESGEAITIPRAPIVYETLEAGSRVYWWTPDGFRSALASE